MQQRGCQHRTWQKGLIEPEGREDPRIPIGINAGASDVGWHLLRYLIGIPCCIGSALDRDRIAIVSVLDRHWIGIGSAPARHWI